MPGSSYSVAEPEPLSSEEELEKYFHDGTTPVDQWRVGVEHEKPIVDPRTGLAVPYEGERGIARVLERFKERTGWNGIYEADKLIALSNGKASITLEPGGQFELSGEAFETLHQSRDELETHVNHAVEIGNELGVAFLGLGITPRSSLDEAPWMPKQRYRIMRKIMTETGKLGHRMMQQTTTVQANFDYKSDVDARDKLRIAVAMSPVLIAMSANSPIVDGRLTERKSFRAHVWTDTDAARCGVLPFVFDTDDVFGAYTQYALDVPMYFVSRGDDLFETGGMTFREFMKSGFRDCHATLDDWSVHLTTLFPEARMKTYIEVRAPDSQMPSHMLATPALMKGLMYEPDCLAASWDVVRKWSLDQRLSYGDEASKHGMAARFGQHSVGDYARELLEVAREGLRRQARLDTVGQDESVYLEPLVEDVENGLCPADRVIADWESAVTESAGTAKVDERIRHLVKNYKYESLH